MTVHLVKLCVGAGGLDDLAGWQARRVSARVRAGLSAHGDHVTRMTPKRRDELLDGGSLFWVIKGVIRARQAIADLEAVLDADGVPHCAILLNPLIVVTEATPRAPFQGWRYLETTAAPADLRDTSHEPGAELPPALRAELKSAGVW